MYIYTSPQLRGYKFYCVSQLIGAISHIYIWRLIYINSFMRTRPFFAKKFFRETFANSMFIFRRTHVSTMPLMKTYEN